MHPGKPGCPASFTPAPPAAPLVQPTTAGVGRLVLDILHALAEGHDATGHEVQGAVSPSLLLLVRGGGAGSSGRGACLLGRAGEQRSSAALCGPPADRSACMPLPPQGAPGTGKTTLLRDVALMLSDTFRWGCWRGTGAGGSALCTLRPLHAAPAPLPPLRKTHLALLPSCFCTPDLLQSIPPCRRSVVVVDTSNEVAGDASVPHPCIGGARRMMVRDRRAQHETMTECVCNHNPDVSFDSGFVAQLIGWRGGLGKRHAGAHHRSTARHSPAQPHLPSTSPRWSPAPPGGHH